MSGTLRRMLGWPEGDTDEYEYEDGYEAEPEHVEPARKVTPLRATETELSRIVTIHPTTYNEAREIGEAFRDGVPVIMNLTGMSEAEAKRMVDFSAGLVFGLRGVIERVTNRVFLLSPSHVAINGERTESRFFNQG